MSTAVFFFGGWKSHLVNIKDWTADALKQKPSVTFDGFPFPDIESSDDDDAVAAFSNPKHNDLAAAIKMIEASTRDVIFIVGHSSGCAIANKVDEGLKDHKKIVLVALDGFAPSHAQLERTTTQVWSAESGVGKSLNHDRMLARIEDYNQKAKNKQKVNMFQAAAGCTTKVALHFSLVNLASSDALVKHIPDGYKSCQANLPWLP
jgi:N-acetylglutamate synthase/N-acetylornithine aminotransferase